MGLEIRKFVNYSELVHIEGFKKADKPLHIFAVAAVITNPWSGKYIDDLKPEIHSFAPILGQELSESCLLYTSPSPRDALTSRMPSSA